MGRRLVVADHKKAKHAIKRVARFMGYLIQTAIGRATEVLLTLDWTDPQDGVHQIVALNLRAHGRALPLAWVTAHKDRVLEHYAGNQCIETHRVKQSRGKNRDVQFTKPFSELYPLTERRFVYQ